MLFHKLNKKYWMREIKLLLSAKLCAVTVFAWLVSLSNHKNVHLRFHTALSLLHICDPAGVCGEKLPQCVEIADSRPLQRSPFRIACALWLPR